MIILFRHANQVSFDAHSIDQIWLGLMFSGASIAVFLVSFLCCLIVARRRREKLAAG